MKQHFNTYKEGLDLEALYATLFKRPENYLKVIECLSDGRRSGMTRDEILKESKLSDGGTSSIDNDYAKDLQNKLDAYRELSKDKRTLHLVMVTTNGFVHNNHYNMVQKEITMDQLFE